VEGAIHGTPGREFMEVGQYTRALALHAEHMAISDATGDRAGVAEACDNLGNCYKSTGGCWAERATTSGSRSKRRATSPPPRAPSCRASPRGSAWSSTWARTRPPRVSV
jgi:hypothetical protein